MQVLGATGQIIAGFGLLELVEALGLVPDTSGAWYPAFRKLLEACRAVSNSEGAHKVEAAIERLGLCAASPVATTRMQGSEQKYENCSSDTDESTVAKCG